MEASGGYEQAPRGPYLVGGMKGIFLPDVVRTVHMTLDLVRLRGKVVGMLITNLAKYFDIIAQVHPMVIGLGTNDHLFAHTQGYKYTMLPGTLQSRQLDQLLGIP